MHKQARKIIKKIQAKKLVKTNKSNFFSWNCIFGSFPQFKNSFLSIFEIAKNGIWSNKLFVKLIYLISQVFWPGLSWIFCPSVECNVARLVSLYFQKLKSTGSFSSSSLCRPLWNRSIRKKFEAFDFSIFIGKISGNSPNCTFDFRISSTGLKKVYYLKIFVKLKTF